MSEAIKDGLARVGLRRRFDVTVSRRGMWRRFHLRLASDLMDFPLPSGGTWFARICWEGSAVEALERLARLQDDAGQDALFEAFPEWFPEATYWPEGWREALVSR
jgi:hypothetical protein